MFYYFAVQFLEGFYTPVTCCKKNVRKEFITVVVHLILPSGPTGKYDLYIINVLGNNVISFQMKKTKYNNIQLALKNMLWNEGVFL